MKFGVLGPWGGMLLGAGIWGLCAHFIPVTSWLRWVGFLVGAVAFLGGVALAIKGEKKQ